MATQQTMKKLLALDKLTLDEIYDLESEHPPLVGNRTNVFLQPLERSAARAGLDRLYRRSVASEATTLHEGKGKWVSEAAPKRKSGAGKNQGAAQFKRPTRP